MNFEYDFLTGLVAGYMLYPLVLGALFVYSRAVRAVKNDVEENYIMFRNKKTEEILRLDDDGMTYNGVRIHDAGQAHQAFLKFMKNANETVENS